MNPRVMAGLVLAMALPALDLMALRAAAPEIAGDLGRLDQLAWLFVSYQLALVVSVPLYGKLGDLRGRRLVFLFSVSFFTVSSLLAGLAWSFPVLVGARLAQGVGAGGIVSQTHAVIADLVPARERGRYSWLTPTVWTVAAFSGPVFGGALAEHLSWRWIFLVNLPFGVLSIVFVRGPSPLVDPSSDGRSIFRVPCCSSSRTDCWSSRSRSAAISSSGAIRSWSAPWPRGSSSWPARSSSRSFERPIP
ncbi:MAG: MFS transporter [Acidimicrobiales bacterium]